MKILIDNGHGKDTYGKRSPDGKFREYSYNRLIANAVVQLLQYRGYDAELLVPEEEDIPLSERVRRVNKHCQELGKDNVCLVSIHVNAVGDGIQWLPASGWSCYTSKGETPGDVLATHLYNAAEEFLKGHNIRKDFSDGDPDFEREFVILKHTACAAALTENGYMDSKLSLKYLRSEEGKMAIIGLHVVGIINYINSK